jgi:hypothetical protein
MRETYAEDLALSLVLRGLSDAQIRDALVEVHEYDQSGQDPVEELGTARDYAKTFPKVRGSTRPLRTARAAGAVGLVWMVLGPFALNAMDVRPPIGFGVTYWAPALLLMTLGVRHLLVSSRARVRAVTRPGPPTGAAHVHAPLHPPPRRRWRTRDSTARPPRDSAPSAGARREYPYLLAASLFFRGASDRTIREALAEVLEIERQGADPTRELGDAERYADTFPEGRRPSRTRTEWRVGALVGGAWLIVATVLVLARDWTPQLGVLALVLPALGAALLGVLVGFIADLRHTARLVRELW